MWQERTARSGIEIWTSMSHNCILDGKKKVESPNSELRIVAFTDYWWINKNVMQPTE